MKRMKWLSALCAGCMLLSLASVLGGCKPKPPASSGTGDDGDINLQGTELRCYAWGDGLSDTEKERNAYIEEKTGMKIRYIKIAYGQMDMKYVLDISADNAPDLLYLTDERFPRYIVQQIGQPLDDYAEKYLGADDEWWKLVKEKSPFKWQGKVYGGSTGPAPYLLWYNKTMFEENDVKTPLEYLEEGNWNWDALAACGKALTADTDGDGALDRFGFQSWKVENMIINNGGNFFDFQSDGKILATVDDQKVLNALEYIQQSGYKDKWMRISGDWVKDFVSERLAMTVETTWFRNDPASDVKFEVDFVPLPAGPDNSDGALHGYAASFGICRGAKNPYGAIAYLKYEYEYNQSKKDQPSEYDHLYTDEQKARLKEYQKLSFNCGFLYGVGDMAGLQAALFSDILSGTPVATAAAKQKDVFQAEADKMQNFEMPEVLPFTAPPVLTFEDDSYLQEIIFENEKGELQGIDAPVITTEPGEAIDGRSLKFNIHPDDAFQMFRFADGYTFPAYHTYTVSFDYKMLEDMSDGGRFLVAICPKNSTVGGPHTSPVALTDLRAGDSGTFTAEMDVYSYGNIEEYTLAFVGINAGSIVIDNFKIVDVADA